jgi:hypothetical protein
VNSELSRLVNNAALKLLECYKSNKEKQLPEPILKMLNAEAVSVTDLLTVTTANRSNAITLGEKYIKEHRYILARMAAERAIGLAINEIKDSPMCKHGNCKKCLLIYAEFGSRVVNLRTVRSCELRLFTIVSF